VRFTNRTDFPTAVHWHGVRLDNRFDGVPHLTQEPVEPGGSFEYKVRFRDAGLYWYHPHHREDVLQDLGLYGNLLVRSRDPGSAAVDAADGRRVRAIRMKMNLAMIFRLWTAWDTNLHWSTFTIK